MSIKTEKLQNEGETRWDSDDFSNKDLSVGIKEIHDLKYQVKCWKYISMTLLILLSAAIFWGSYETINCQSNNTISQDSSDDVISDSDYIPYNAPESGLTTADIKQIIPNEYWTATTYKISDIHNFHPESTEINLPKPEIGWTCWWSEYGIDGYDPIGVAFTNAIININTMEIIHESPLSDLLYKPYSYNGKDGKFHIPMFQVRGSSNKLVNGHVAYLINLYNKTQWKRIGIKISKPAADKVEDDQTSFTVNYKQFSWNEGIIFKVRSNHSNMTDSSEDTKVPGSVLTTLDISDVLSDKYWNAITYKIADIHNFHPESNAYEFDINLPKPEIGWTCWWAEYGIDGYDPIGIAFTNAIINKTNMEVIYESVLSDLVYKSWSYNGKDGKFHKSMFQVRGSSNLLVNGHVAYMFNLDSMIQWKRIGVKISKIAADKVEDDQTSFTVTNKLFTQNDGEIFAV